MLEQQQTIPLLKDEMLLGQELKFKNKLCNLKLGTLFSALPGLGASALSGRIGSDMTHLPRSFCPCRPDGFEIRPPAIPHPR